MIRIPAGRFRMGSDRHYPEEAPAHTVRVDAFDMRATAVTNREFATFVDDTGYRTVAERPLDPKDYPGAPVENLAPGSMVFTMTPGPVDLRHLSQWWTWTPGASWRHPEGPGTTLEHRADHPVVHVAFDDAAAWAAWAGDELPTEAGWERAARGGVDGQAFTWGDEAVPGGRYLANFWQGDFGRVPAADRLAVFDNDGTLWCERPQYPQLRFMVDELEAAVDRDPDLATRPEYRAVLDRDRRAIAGLGLPRVALALAEVCAGWEPEHFDTRVRSFFADARHRHLDRRLADVRYQPMLELLDELRRRDVTVAIVTGGGTEFVRAVSADFYGVAPELVVGSRVGYDVDRDDRDEPVLRRTADLDGQVNEGAAKVTHIQRGLGRRPVLAAGNSPGDTEMLEYALATSGPSLALLVDHDDADREYDYRGEAASSMATRTAEDSSASGRITRVSMRRDWATVFPPASTLPSPPGGIMRAVEEDALPPPSMC